MLTLGSRGKIKLRLKVSFRLKGPMKMLAIL